MLASVILAACLTFAQKNAAAQEGEEKWLWVGARGGMSFRFYDRPDGNLFVEEGVIYFLNVNAALQVSGHLFPWLDVQAEAIYTTDNAPFTLYAAGGTKTFPFYSQSFMFPLLLRLGMRNDSLAAGILGGAYFFLPLGQMRNDAMGGSFDYESELPVGYTVGFNIGMRLGPGYLFFDTRWAADLGALYSASGDDLYKRSMVTLNIGYEFGFINKGD
jgi:hypothetical protein